MMLYKIASRNLWRNKKRSFIIMGAVILGLWSGTFLMAFYNGVIDQRIQNAIGSELSHLQFHHPQFRKEYEPSFFIPNGKRILFEIKDNNKTKYAAGRLILKGMIASANVSTGITINGINPFEERQIINLDKKIVEGDYLDTTSTNQIVLSHRMIKKLKLKLHQKAILTFQDRGGNLTSGAFRIKGVFETVNTPYDDSNVFVKINTADSLAGVPGQINEIALLLKSNDDLKSVQSYWQKKIPSLEILNWMEISPELGYTVEANNQMVYIFMGIILLALAFGIINTMMMSVLERSHELAILLSLGMNRSKIFSMIMLETFLLILISSPIGIFLAIITTEITHKTGIDFSQYKEVYSNFGYSSVFYPKLSMNHLYVIMVLVIITAFISAIFPARKALKINIAESLKK